VAFLIALEGIDGSGKGTQAQRLVERLTGSVRLVSFPRYGETLFGRAVGEFLNGRFGTLDAVHPVLASLLYAGDRFESRGLLREALADNGVLVIDRYVASNIAHQGAKLEGAERREFIDWIAAVEHDVYELPRPHLTLLLDLPADQAQQLIARKRPRDYTDKAADIQEADAGYLSRVREVYLELSAGRPDWHRVECCRDGEIRTIDDVAEEIWNVVKARIIIASLGGA
jgi:dTMP kinase